MLAHGPEQFRAGGAERMGWLLAQACFQIFSRRETDAIFLNKPADRRSVAFAAQTSGEQREMDISARFIPSAKSSCCNIFLHAFSGPALEGEFPIMDGTGPVRRQMSEPATRHQSKENARRAIFNQVRAVDKKHARAAFARGDNLFRALLDPGLNRRG